MSIRDLDPIELLMGKRVELMEPKELFDYFEKWYEGLFEVKLPQDRVREMGYFKNLKKVYGPDAGRIIKWFFCTYQGIWKQTSGKNAGQFTRVKVNWWSARSKDWHDVLLDEVRAEMSKEKQAARSTTTKKKSTSGFKGAGSLLG